MTPLLIASFCILAFAAAAQATTGFGFALVGVRCSRWRQIHRQPSSRSPPSTSSSW
ncbi:hypothetical protein [Blastococcus sp. Marseille-P5729]|uniref:hypothetical protein n=1 Tax=Blastococcus sp. Marseille-P5729 TaxID=2086582 RepID=UPI00131C5B16|nr:hypothetical protein [Blastococcus sp. Marseille-P5729]